MWATSEMAYEILETIIKQDGFERLDQFVGRIYGFTDKAVEAVLDANPGLAALGAFPPEGTAIKIPKVEPASDDTDLIRPWD